MILTGLTVAAVLGGAQLLARRRNAREWTRHAERAAGLRSRGRMPILMPVCGRPAYLRRVLEALAQVEGIDETLIVFSQDGCDPEVSALIEGVSFTEKIVLKHTRPFCGLIGFFRDNITSVSANLHQVIEFSFLHLGSEAVVVLEDDLQPSPDFYRYFEWVERYLLDDPQAMTVTAFNLHSREWPERGFDPRRQPLDVLENREQGVPFFTAWSWCIRRKRWETVAPRWSFTNWDIGLSRLQRELGLRTYKPVLSRVKNIGMQGGINFTESEDNPKWSGLCVSAGRTEFKGAPLIVTEEVIPPVKAYQGPSLEAQGEAVRNRPRLWALVIVLLVTGLLELRFLWLR